MSDSVYSRRSGERAKWIERGDIVKLDQPDGHGSPRSFWVEVASKGVAGTTRAPMVVIADGRGVEYTLSAFDQVDFLRPHVAPS